MITDTERYAFQRATKWFELAFAREQRGQEEKASRAYQKANEWSTKGFEKLIYLCPPMGKNVPNYIIQKFER